MGCVTNMDIELPLGIADVGSVINDLHLCRHQHVRESWHEHHGDQIHFMAKRSGHHAYLHA